MIILHFLHTNSLVYRGSILISKKKKPANYLTVEICYTMMLKTSGKR